jgi:hypothetical protein
MIAFKKNLRRQKRGTHSREREHINQLEKINYKTLKV